MTKKLDDLKKTNKNLHKKDEAEILWDYVTSGVTPLNKRLKNRSSVAKVIFPLKNTDEFVKEKIKFTSSYQAQTQSKSSLPQLKIGGQIGLDKKNAKKLRKGQHIIEGRIDLHGLNRTQAKTALNSFIENSYSLGKRCVLVITGKGLKSDGSIGVLRENIPDWLNERRNRGLIIAFSHAVQKDGGEGAFYVMLKRKR